MFVRPFKFIFIENAVSSNEFPYYYQGRTTSLEEDGIALFTHRLFDIDQDGVLSNAYDLIMPSILKGLPDCKKLLRAKVNLYINQNPFIP